MSIWSSIGEPVEALDGHDEAANYRAEGEPSLAVDVATANHDHIRLAIWNLRAGPRPVDVCALISREAAFELVKKLNDAIAHTRATQ
jgi:hypothetical protein